MNRTGSVTARIRPRRGSRGGTGAFTWPDALALINRRQIDRLVVRLSTLDAGRRAALAPEVVRYVEGVADGLLVGPRPFAAAVPTAVLTTGCLDDPYQVADLLLLPGFHHAFQLDDWEPAVRTAAARGPSWQCAVGEALAERDAAGAAWRLTAALIEAGGAAWPTGDAFVAGWVRHHVVDVAPGRALDRLRDDVRLDLYLARLFEVDGIGDLLRLGLYRPPTSPETPLTFVEALTLLAAEGRLVRTELLDRSLTRLLRGDRRLRGYRELLELLGPRPQEVAARAETFGRLLVEGSVTVAALAQKALRTADDAGLLDAEFVLGIGRRVLRRPDPGLIEAQLRWIERAAARDPARVDRWREVLAAGRLHRAGVVRERTRAVVGRLDSAPSAAVRSADVLPSPPSNEPPPPVGSVEELVDGLTALATGPVTAFGLERVLDGLPRLYRTARVTLIRAVCAVRQRHFRARDRAPMTAVDGLSLVLAAVLDGPRRIATPVGLPAPQRIVLGRCLELAHRIGEDIVRPPVATPTRADGALDPEALYERLARAAHERWQPGAYDLTQALLRLPDDAPAHLARRAVALGTSAGMRLAERLESGGPSRPAFHRVVIPRRTWEPDAWSDGAHDRLPAARILIGMTAQDDPYGLLTLPLPEVVWLRDPHPDEALWPAVLPGQREVIAAHVLPSVAALADCRERGAGALLPLLAGCTGPAGPALPLAVAYGLAARWTPDRTAAVEALLLLAGAGTLDADRVGTELADLVSHGLVRGNRAVESLSDVVAAGAPGVAWSVLRTALPHLLASERPPPRSLGAILAVARDAARETAATDPIAGLDALARRPGRTRLAVEARQLRETLGAR
jgi:hypothetical protein